jgi:hypothetical protein
MARLEPDDPNRCQGTAGNFQCHHPKVAGSNFCQYHASARDRGQVVVKSTRQYRLAKWQARLSEFAEHPEIKSLREEIGIARITLEEIINQCHSPQQLVMASQRVSDLVTRIEKLVSACHRLEERTGAVLDKTAAIQLANRIISVIADHVENADVLEKVADELIKAVINEKPSGTNVS